MIPHFKIIIGITVMFILSTIILIGSNTDDTNKLYLSFQVNGFPIADGYWIFYYTQVVKAHGYSNILSKEKVSPSHFPRITS